MSKKNPGLLSGNFVFRKHSNLGAADAIDDTKFLSECFIDNGEIDILCDMNSPQCILTGRTGSGKTAILERLNNTVERVIEIAPEGLALAYVSNNEVLNFFMNSGVNMDLFYRLLWRHVFAVEIIKEHCNIVNEKARDNFLSQLLERFKSHKPRQEAIDYFIKWGDKFWLDSEARVKEVTKTLEQKLGATLDSTLEGNVPGMILGGVSLNSEIARNLTEEQKSEIVRRGQSVVDSVQMKTLSEVIDILEKEILLDKQKKYYITIDRLDEHWVNDDLRYLLIRALLDTVRDFNNKIRNVKIIVAIREDLLDRVFRYTRSPGYQEEKYKSMYLPITWNEYELEELVDKRVNQLVKEQYTSAVVCLKHLLPTKINKQEPVVYLISRTMLRPRDIIMFFNECIKHAEGKARFSQTIINQAEAVYSEYRLYALADEWASDYQNLVELVFFLKKFPYQFRLCDENELINKIKEMMFQFLVSNYKEDYLSLLMREKFDNDQIEEFSLEMTRILYKTGVLGIKQDSYSSICWSYQGKKLLRNEINLNAQFYIHPAFWRVLGINPGRTG